LSLVLTYLTPFVLGAPWIVTDYYQAVPEEVYGDYDTSKHRWSIITTTTYQEIIPTATSLPEAIETNVVVESDLYGAGTQTIVEKLYPSGGVGKPVPYSAIYNVVDSQWTSIIWVVNLTYSAPTACSTQWTTTTAVSVTPPADYTFDRLLPSTAVSTSYSVYNAQGFQSSTYVYKYIFVEPTQVPARSMSSLSSYNYPATLYDYSDKNCRYRGSDNNDYTSYPYDYNDNYNWLDDSYPLGISPLAIILICALGWPGLWFLLGILEAWVRFRRMMTGWQTRRGMPVCWALTILPLTLFCLCCRTKGFRSRNAHDTAVLQSRWKKLTAWNKFTLFLKWGFRYSYPTILGPAPARVSKKPGQHTGPPPGFLTPPQNVVYPPGSHGPQMRQANPNQQQRLGQAPTLQPIPEASGALQREIEQGHEQQQSQPETPVQAQTETQREPQTETQRESQTETETVTETRAQNQTETDTPTETQPQQQKPAQDAEIGRAQ
jgi:hypothetical protein